MANYFNKLKHEWTLQEGNKTYRIVIGINKDLPEGLESKFNHMLVPVGEPEKKSNLPIDMISPIKYNPILDKSIVTIIMVTYKDEKSIFEEIINQIGETDYEYSKLKFIFVDNNVEKIESDNVQNAINKLRQKFSSITVISNNNKGVLSGAMNRALDACDTELFVYLCSKHIYIYDKDWLKDLMAHMKATGIKESKYIIGGTISQATGPHIQGGLFIGYTEIFRKIRYDEINYPFTFMDVNICKRILAQGYKFLPIDTMFSKMSGWSPVQHKQNLLEHKYKIVHSHETLEYRKKKRIEVSDTIKYSISLVCHNNVTLTIKCLESIIKLSGKNREDYEILIVNNASTDGTKDYLEKFKVGHQNSKNIQILHSEKNQGFMAPQNYNASIASGKYFIVLNNDLEVCKGWLEELEKPFHNNSKMAIVGLKQNPASLTKDGSGYFDKKVEYIEMSCAMIKNDLVKKYGLFDDKMLTFGYCEDTDFSLRLREKGYEIATVDLPIQHFRASTMKNVQIDVDGHQVKNKSLVRQRWKIYFKNRNFNYKILVRRTSAIGDVILTTGVIHRLREKYPLSDITFQSGCCYIFLRNPDVNHVVSAEEILDVKSFDMVFDLDMSYESDPQNHIIDVYSKICGVNNKKDLFLYPDPAYEEKIIKLFKDKKVAVIHCEPTPGWSGRELPIDRFKFVEEYLRKKGFSILEVGLKYKLKSDINYQDTNWEALCSIIKHSKIFVGLDSGPFHIAQAFKIPSVVPFGMIDPKYRVNDFSVVSPVVSEWVNCKGCHHWQEQPTIFSSKCLRDKHYCMLLISKEDMRTAIDKILKEIKC